jgi:hypothetical protein
MRNFCGTIGRYDGKFLTLALHCLVLQKPIMDLADAQYEAQTGLKKSRKSHPTLGAPVTEETGQIRMFPLSTEQREEFTKFAKNLQYFLKDDDKANAGMWDWITATKDFEFADYDHHVFFDAIPNEKLRPGIEMMFKVGRGEPLEDYVELVKFLSWLNGRALHEHEDRRMSESGGCF